MTAPTPVIHPPHILRTLDRLTFDRPPTPWDSKVERLLNGLRASHLYVGRSLDDGVPWLLDMNLLGTHAWIRGGTGSGKTALALAPMAFQRTAYADSSIVYIDLKGDNALFWGAFVEAQRAGLPFRWFTLEPGASSFAFNPITQQAELSRNVYARAQSFLSAMGLAFGSAYGKGYFTSVTLDTLTAFIGKFRDIQSFADMSRYAEQPGSYIATHTDEENSQHLRMQLRQLASVAPLNVTEGVRPPVAPEVLRDAIDFSDVLTRKQVVYFSLPSQEEEQTAKSVAKLALYSLMNAAKAASRTCTTVPVDVFIDEFQQVCGDNIKILLEMARSLGIRMILSHQDVSQLKTVDFDITSIVESCTTFHAIMEASSVAGMKHLQDSGGESRQLDLSWMQQVRPSFDERDDTALSLARAYPRHDFEPATASVGEVVRPRLSKNQILSVSAHPMQGFVRSRTDGGLTQYAGQWSAVEWEFPIPFDEYKARSKTPWPTEHPSCVTVDGGSEEGLSESASPQNKALPVSPPSKEVDKAIAERLLSHLLRTSTPRSAGAKG